MNLALYFFLYRWVMQSRQRMIVPDNTAQPIGATTRNGDDL